MPTFKEYFQEIYPSVSMEDLIDGKVHQELEYTVYAEVADMEELRKAARKVERQEQWLIPLDKEQQRADGKIRIRLIDGARPTMAVKIKGSAEMGCMETESDISMDTFNQMRKLAVGGYIKNRYSIPSKIEGLIWEVDVFQNHSGQPHPWVKIDLEVKSLADPIPNFPIKINDLIQGDGEKTIMQEERIKGLWEREWSRLDVKS